MECKLPSPARFVVIGNPIAHSMSPFIHSDFAAQLGIDMQYRRLLAPLNGFSATVQALRAAGVQGASVTVPFKFEACQLADFRSPAVEFAGAANTLKFIDGALHADNTDGGGLCRDLNRLTKPFGVQLADCQVLMLGAGGAASGCVAAFAEHGVQHLTILNRTAAKARDMAQKAEALGLPAAGGGLDSTPNDFDLAAAPRIVVNASAASLQGEALELHPGWFEQTLLAYDMMYAPKGTAFLHTVAGATPSVATSDGLGMLVYQAQLAFEWWTGRSPDAFATLERVRAHLQAKAG